MNYGPTILAYHRVAKVKEDPYRLCVSPENFFDQISYVVSHSVVVPLAETDRILCRIPWQKLKVVLTFDDGYADNYFNALPVLKKFGVPATFFITAGMIGSKKPFYWDAKTRLADRGRAMTGKELKMLVNDPLVEIGSHTLSHPHLKNLTLSRQKKELEESKIELEKMTGREVNSFSYPFGIQNNDWDKLTTRLVKEVGYARACTVRRSRVNLLTSPFELPRFIVRNWNSKEFSARFTALLKYEYPLDKFG